MNRRFPVPLALALALPLAVCQREAPEAVVADAGESEVPPTPGDISDNAPFSLIGEGETVRFTGTEPFWGGEASGSSLTYSTPENIDGTEIAVERFEGRGGLTFSGMLDGANFDLLVTEGQCSDGMSDRSYPFVATLSLGEELRNGCAWSDAHPATGGEGN